MHRAAVRQHSSNSNIKVVHNSIWHFLCNPSDFSSDDVLSCLWIVFTNCVFEVLPQKIVRWVEILGLGWPGVIGLIRKESVAWEVMPEVFKCSVRETSCHLINWHDCVKPITRGHPILTISTRLIIFWEGTWKTEFVKTTHRQERTSSEKKSGGFHKKCSIELWTILMF